MDNIRAALLALLIAVSDVVLAQVQEAPKKQDPAKKPLHTTTSTVKPVSFDGGPLDSYIAEVRKQFPESNITIDGRELEKVMLPKAPLPRVSVRAAFEWIPRAANAQAAGLVLHAPPIGRDGEGVWLLTTMKKANAPTPAHTTPLPPQPDANQVKPYALPNALKYDDVKKAIDHGANLRKSETSNVTYQPDSRVLFVKGTRNDIASADQIVDAMTRRLEREKGDELRKSSSVN